MKRWGIALLVIVALAAGLWPSAKPAQAQNTQNFTIQSFQADYYLDKDSRNVSTMKVVETIEATFPEYNQNRGILRAIPKEYKDNSVDVTVDSVVDQGGTPYKYSDYSENDNLVLRIGDPDVFVHGPTTYVITYYLKNVISFYDQHDEFYWDINGDQWPQSMDRVEARLHLPGEIASQVLSNQVACFAGAYEQNNRQCQLDTSTGKEGTIIKATTEGLSGYETLSMVVGFKKGTFEPDRLAALWKLILVIAVVAAIVVPPLIILILILHRWHKSGRDPAGRGVIIPQYQAPKETSVIVSDVVLNERLGLKAITATIIDLAIRGYAVINETTTKKFLKDKTEFSLELVKPPQDLKKEELETLEIFFGSNPAAGATVQLKDLKSTVYTKVAALGTTASKLTADQGYFMTNPQKARRYFLVPAILLLVIGFVISFTVVGIPLGIGLSIGAIMLFIANAAMPARTTKGVELREYLLGLKVYIQMAEVDRLKFLQSVKGAQRIMKGKKSQIKLFEELLPYAMLLGLEKSWAAEFQDVYAQPPNWYHGNWSTFNSVYLASSLSNFTAVSASTFSPPSSSGSSGFSSGGGFSGGGGGGGGGGGW